jgi:long-chain acyl-CoA synthetase
VPEPSLNTVAAMFLHRVAATPDREAYDYPANGAWKSLRWRDVGERVRAIACGLRALGLADEDRCAILCATRYEWLLADLGILLAGGATTTIYPSSTAAECTFILTDSGTRFAFVENAAQLAKLQSERERLPDVKKVILIDPDGEHAGGDWVMTLSELMALGRAHDAGSPDDYERIARAVRPGSLATLIYTSGTTGRPKGVELTHDCWAYEGEGIAALGILSADDVQYLWLPLAHSFGKVLESAQLAIGFRTAIDGRVDKLVANLAVVRPTFVAAVPRIFEKVHNKVVAGAQEGGALKARLVHWAFDVGRRVSALKQAGKEPGGLLALQNAIAERLVFAKIKALFGGRLRFFVSGSAPLSREISEFFHAAGIVILEGYGLTESSAASVVNRTGKYRLGTVGLPLPGTTIRIAEDGEILLHGRGIMRGYHNLPEATAETLDGDRWLRTGDIGHVDADGFLRITDRKKDLIKTSGGKYVAPQALEGKLKALCPYISQVLVHGNNRNFVSALVTLDEESIRRWAKDNGLGDLDYAAIAANDKVRAMVAGAVDQLNAQLARHEQVKKFALLPRDLTQEADELTPSLKVKRKVVEKRYQAILDGFYEGTVAADA